MTVCDWTARVWAWMSYARHWVACEDMRVPSHDAARMCERFGASLWTRGVLVETWLNAAQISARWENAAPFRVGQIVRLLGLHKSTSHARWVVDRNEYSPAAIGLIERELLSRGHKRS